MGPYSQYRVTWSASPQAKLAGCAGCLVALFVAGGVVGVLVFGWKTLLGL